MKAKTKRNIAGTIAALGFIFALGTVGGMELFDVTLGLGLCRVAIGLLAFWIGGCKAGWFRW